MGNHRVHSSSLLLQDSDMLKLVALSLLIVTISAQELGADDILEDITSGVEEEWGAPAPAPAPAAAPGEAPVPAHKGDWHKLATKTTGWWGKHAHASAPASDGKSWGKIKTKGKKIYGKRRGSGSGSGKKKFSWGKIKAKGKSWLNKAKTKGKSWLTKGKSWLNKAKTKGKLPALIRCLPCPACPVGQFAADEEVQLDERGCPKCRRKKCRPVKRAPCKCAKPACPKCDEYADEYEELEVQAIPCMCPSFKCRACAMTHHFVVPKLPKPALLHG